MSTQPTRPVHPCVLSLFDGNRGAEYSAWAYITTRPPQVPNLVTASASTVRIFTLDETSGKLYETYSFPDLAGNVCYLATLHTSIRQADSLLLGFCGNPRLTIVSVTTSSNASSASALLSATTLLDLTQALIDRSFGSVTPLEHDLVATTVLRKNNEGATTAVILGGGVAVACIDLKHDKKQGGRWWASEPFFLPLATLQGSIQRSQTSKVNGTSGALPSGSLAASSNVSTISTGFGDVLSSTFLPGYSEPTLVLLHSNPTSHGRAWSGRLGRPHWQPATRFSLIVTAISVTASHQRSAVLWSVEVPADAHSLYQIGNRGCLVVSSNSLLAIDNSGRIEDFLAVNGYVRSTCPSSLLGFLKPNPKPFPKLALQLDGASLAFCSESAVMLSLRAGSTYLLQLGVSSCRSRGSEDIRMSLLPIGRSLGTCGYVENLIAWPLACVSNVLYDKFIPGVKQEDSKESSSNTLSMGLLFVGSRLGDSYLLGYVVEAKGMPWIQLTTPGKKTKLQSYENGGEPRTADPLELLHTNVSPEEEEILRFEEDALYAPTRGEDSQMLHVVPPSDEEESEIATTQIAAGNKRKSAATVAEVAVLKALTTLDILRCLGPLGAPCEGPLVPSIIPQGDTAASVLNPSATTVAGATAFVAPCGYGSSGGVGILTVPGRDDRTIEAEVDCLGIGSVFALAKLGLVLMGKVEGGIRVMRLEFPESQTEADEDDNEDEVEAINLVELSSDRGDESTKDLLLNATMLSSESFCDREFAIVCDLARGGTVTNQSHVRITVLKESSGRIQMLTSIELPSGNERGTITSMTPLTSSGSDASSLLFACTWSNGVATLVEIEKQGIRSVFDFPLKEKQAGDTGDSDNDSEKAMIEFYSNRRICAVDLFRAPSKFFDSFSPVLDPPNAADGVGQPTNVPDEMDCCDDNELYVNLEDSSIEKAKDYGFTQETSSPSEDLGEEVLFVAVCRQSGEIEIYLASDLRSGKQATPVWACAGCSYGRSSLVQGSLQAHTLPKQHETVVREMRFFVSGQSVDSGDQTIDGLSRSLCLAIETGAGDLFLYVADRRTTSSCTLQFTRVPLKYVARESQERHRARAKLRRKGIVSKAIVQSNSFQHNRLHRFNSLSNQDGLFAAVARPVWLVAERGKLTPIVHRSRHSAPAGGATYPISGFCCNLDKEGSFLTVHERVGRSGSQRLTIHNEISPLFHAEGLLPGGGLCLEKVPLGVTVRHVQFVDDDSLSRGNRCLYAMLVSREREVDMSHLNDDGMSREERERMEQEKEAAKIKRQVEADLGGFDVEQEWVEEIEREDCFEIDRELGGAPPLLQHSYALWIVDAANGWVVVDSHELEEFDLGMTMRVMSLTDFPEAPGNTNATNEEGEELETKLFIAVGVGVVDKNGEDVSSKGKVLLFELEERDELTSRGVELSLRFEKDIFHGPVSSLTCLKSGGKNRLIIGAGADINVEQWGNEKLTQVGFFRATMQILDVFMFKSFLLLSDAYDSLYFLVWRESDKSLTVLSKDYDPLAVYAAGTMSRGSALTFICQDDRQNLQFFQYAPGEAAARGGNKLVCRADFHLGSQTSAFRNHTCRSSIWVNSATPVSTLAALKQQDAFFGRSEDDQRVGAHFGSCDGGFGAIVPLSEPVYWRLNALQSVMANALESDCALSQRAWRFYRRSYRRGGCRSTDRKKGVIDGDLVAKYADLPLRFQEDLASAVGSTVELILDNILELQCAVSII